MIRKGRRGASGVHTPEEPSKPYDFIEVMACPSGCVNGGGQVPPIQASQLSRPRLDQEKMPVPMELDDEIKVVADLSGRSEQDIGVPAKAWLARVEQAYWTIGGDDTALAPLADTAGVHSSIMEYIHPSTSRNAQVSESHR